MRASHDLGGLEDLGPILPEQESSEQVFHAGWEKRVFSLTLAVGFLGRWNLDQSRHARERQKPEDYLRHTYYENWWVGLKTLLLEKGLISNQELKTGKPDSNTTDSGLSALQADDVGQILLQGGSVEMETEKYPKFLPGDRVRVREEVTLGHTRVPGYIRGKIGEIDRHHGAHVFADRNALGFREAEHLYSIRFPSRGIWGKNHQASAAFTVRVDLWEPHLESV